MGFRKKNAFKDYLKGLLVGTAIISIAVLICILTGTASFTGLSKDFTAVIIFLFFLVFAKCFSPTNSEITMIYFHNKV